MTIHEHDQPMSTEHLQTNRPADVSAVVDDFAALLRVYGQKHASRSAAVIGGHEKLRLTEEETLELRAVATEVGLLRRQLDDLGKRAWDAMCHYLTALNSAEGVTDQEHVAFAALTGAEDLMEAAHTIAVAFTPAARYSDGCLPDWYDKEADPDWLLHERWKAEAQAR